MIRHEQKVLEEGDWTITVTAEEVGPLAAATTARARHRDGRQVDIDVSGPAHWETWTSAFIDGRNTARRHLKIGG